VSFDIVRESIARTETHIKEMQVHTPYVFQQQALTLSKELFLKWLNIYKTYADGYSKELLARTNMYVIRMLSSFSDNLERHAREVFEARIPNESYILINEFLTQLGQRCTRPFVLAEGPVFSQTSIFKQLTETMDKISEPRPVKGGAQIDINMSYIRDRDVLVIHYEQGQYDNVLSWPLLLHEAFHHVYSSERLDRLVKDCPQESWLEEALIDMYLVNYFGPAYALSLAIYLQRFPHERTVSHPSFAARIFIALQYLTRMKQESKLPTPIGEHASDLFEYLEKIWNQHKTIDTSEVQEKVEEIYNGAEQGVISVISEKSQPFSEFLIKSQEERRKVHERGGFQYAENQILSASDVENYFDAGIPVAADPRTVFNAFLSQRSPAMFHDPRLRTFIVESLKRWHLKRAWRATVSSQR
jgi:hypothetical protein